MVWRLSCVEATSPVWNSAGFVFPRAADNYTGSLQTIPATFHSWQQRSGYVGSGNTFCSPICRDEHFQSKVRPGKRHASSSQRMSQSVWGRQSPSIGTGFIFSGKNSCSSSPCLTFGKPVNMTVQLAEGRGEKRPRFLGPWPWLWALQSLRGGFCFRSSWLALPKTQFIFWEHLGPRSRWAGGREKGAHFIIPRVWSNAGRQRILGPFVQI